MLLLRYLKLGAFSHRNPTGVLAFLWPASRVGPGVNQATMMQSALLLFIEIAANVLVWTILIAAPVAWVVAIRRALSRPKTPASQ